MGRMKRALLVAVLLAAVALPGTASASGASCRNKIYNDWYRDGKIASTYPIACYRDAIKHVHSDAAIYSSLLDDIRAAMHAALRHERGLAAPKQVGHGFKALGGGAAIPVSAPSPHDPKSAGPVASTGSGGGTPLPILVLGALALLLVAAGAVGAGVRHVRSRRQ
jgi:hypothetical protein